MRLSLRMLGFVLAAIAPAGLVLAQDSFEEAVSPLLAANCVACHNAQAQSGGVDFAQFVSADDALGKPEVWERALERLSAGTMPPAGLPRPDSAIQERATTWLTQALDRLDAEAEPDPGRVTVRRLNRAEYNNTVRDVFGVKVRPADDFPVDDTGYGFDNIGDVLSISPVLMERYMKAARQVAEAAIVTGDRTVKATRVRYLAKRARRETAQIGAAKSLPYRPDGSMRTEHDFPATGTYRLRMDSTDRRNRRPNRDEDPPPLPPVYPVVFLLDGKELGRAEADGSDGSDGDVEVEIPVEAGLHELRAYFLDTDGEITDPNVANWDIYRNANNVTATRPIFGDSFQIEGPYEAEPAPLPESHRRLMVCQPRRDGFDGYCAGRILSRATRLAFRRPVPAPELGQYVAFAQRAVDSGLSFERGIQFALQAILVSPHFLFRVEQERDQDEPWEVSQLELASRLSYFLWSSAPDDALLTLAESGALREPGILARQVKRMIADPRADALVENFAGQWLELRNLAIMQPDPDKFPDFDEELAGSMRRETELFFAHILRADRPLPEFLSADYTFVNDRLAEHYGIAEVRGEQFRRVDLADATRGGLVSHASVLTVSSYPTRTSPVLRGVWVLDNLLGAPPPDPPDDVPELDEAKIGQELSLRASLEAHRANPACAACHDKMDPIGFGLENYDPIGRWRDSDGGFPIDSAGTLPTGESFSGPAELKGILHARGGEFAKTVADKLLTYALGRGLERYDRPALSALEQRMADEEYRFSALVLGIVESYPFQMQRRDRQGAKSDD